MSMRFDELARAIDSITDAFGRFAQALERATMALDKLGAGAGGAGAGGGGAGGAGAASPGAGAGVPGGDAGLAARAASATAALASRGAGAVMSAGADAARFADPAIENAIRLGTTDALKTGLFQSSAVLGKIPLLGSFTGARQVSRQADVIGEISAPFEALAAAGLEFSDDDVRQSASIMHERHRRSLKARARVSNIAGDPMFFADEIDKAPLTQLIVPDLMNRTNDILERIFGALGDIALKGGI